MDEAAHNLPSEQAQKQPVMLSEKIREVLRLKYYSLRMEEAYWHWIGLSPGEV